MTPLHHLVEGPTDAPVVVLSGSLGADLTMWDAQASALAERFRVVRYDHPGHGGSPSRPGPYALDDLGAEVFALHDHLGSSAPTGSGSRSAAWSACGSPRTRPSASTG